MKYSQLKTGHIFNFVNHPEKDMFLKMDKGFIRLPNKFNYDTLDDGGKNFPDGSIKDVIIIKSRRKIANNLTLRKE